MMIKNKRIILMCYSSMIIFGCSAMLNTSRHKYEVPIYYFNEERHKYVKAKNINELENVVGKTKYIEKYNIFEIRKYSYRSGASGENASTYVIWGFLTLFILEPFFIMNELSDGCARKILFVAYDTVGNIRKYDYCNPKLDSNGYCKYSIKGKKCFDPKILIDEIEKEDRIKLEQDKLKINGERKKVKHRRSKSHAYGEKNEGEL